MIFILSIIFNNSFEYSPNKLNKTILTCYGINSFKNCINTCCSMSVKCSKIYVVEISNKIVLFAYYIRLVTLSTL